MSEVLKGPIELLTVEQETQILHVHMELGQAIANDQMTQKVLAEKFIKGEGVGESDGSYNVRYDVGERYRSIIVRNSGDEITVVETAAGSRYRYNIRAGDSFPHIPSAEYSETLQGNKPEILKNLDAIGEFNALIDDLKGTTSR